jgi:hydrogenase nickel incorporation protein HypA/HybF
MHEQSLIVNLMKKIGEVSLREGGARVKGVSVWIGALAHFSKDHFREHFEEGAKGTVADGAELRMELSEDISDPNAQSVLLRSVDLEQ